MRKLWLLFAQAVTLTLAASFVVSLVKTGLARVARPRDRGARKRSPGAIPRAGAESPAVLVQRRGEERRSRRSSTFRRRGRSAAQPAARRSGFQRFFGERFNPPETQLSLGSGVIVSREGYILTNDHVVEGVSDIRVTLGDGARSKARSSAPIPTRTSPSCACRRAGSRRSRSASPTR
jgi:S1-C subfamily serine protease